MELGRPTLLLVFGAGASNDSISVSGSDPDSRPPLTKELFSAIGLGKFMIGRGAAKSLAAMVMPRLDLASGPSFEEVLTGEYERATGKPTLARGFTALRFYLRDLFAACTTQWPRLVGGVTNYQWLVRSTETWRDDVDGYVLWVTFNYDGLLDQALEDVYRHDLGQPWDDDRVLNGYLSHPDWALIKLHGSYDWRRRTNLSLRAEEGTGDHQANYVRLESGWDAATDVPTDQTVYRREDPRASDASSDRALWIPALMAPLAGKAAFECPPTHVDHLKSRLPSVDVIYTFGWRAQESHFLDLLAAMKPSPPDAYALTAHPESSAQAVSDLVGQASGPMDGGGDEIRGVDNHEGFSRLAIDPSSFSENLATLIERARERRERQASLLEGVPVHGDGKPPSA